VIYRHYQQGYNAPASTQTAEFWPSPIGAVRGEGGHGGGD